MSEMRYFSVGENALTVSFGSEVSRALNRKVLSLARALEENPFPGFIEIVPAYAALTIFYDSVAVRKNFPAAPTARAAVEEIIGKLIEKKAEKEEKPKRHFEIPFDARDEFAPDLEFIGAAKGLAKAEVISIFTARIYTVYMLGFLPGFAYLGEVDERIAAPRRTTPRLRVEKGSVGIAGRQTGVYPLASPGGWQIIGRTKTEFFTPAAEQPTLLQAGDKVKFIAV